MKQTIRLTENELRGMINETVKKALNPTRNVVKSRRGLRESYYFDDTEQMRRMNEKQLFADVEKKFKQLYDTLAQMLNQTTLIYLRGQVVYRSLVGLGLL